MMEKLVKLDKELLIFLNNLGTETYDPFWLFITKQFNWLPFFVFLLYLTYRKVSVKKLALILVVIAGLITFTDQMTNLVKYTVERQRPCNTEDLIQYIRIVKCSPTLSYFSGHASNSMATMLFLYLVLRKYYKYMFLIFLFPLIFAYSRIYLSLHFPLDILSGFCFGLFSGTLFYQIFLWLEKRFAYKLV